MLLFSTPCIASNSVEFTLPIEKYHKNTTWSLFKKLFVFHIDNLNDQQVQASIDTLDHKNIDHTLWSIFEIRYIRNHWNYILNIFLSSSSSSSNDTKIISWSTFFTWLDYFLICESNMVYNIHKTQMYLDTCTYQWNMTPRMNLDNFIDRHHDKPMYEMLEQKIHSNLFFQPFGWPMFQSCSLESSAALPFFFHSPGGILVGHSMSGKTTCMLDYFIKHLEQSTENIIMCIESIDIPTIHHVLARMNQSKIYLVTNKKEFRLISKTYIGGMIILVVDLIQQSEILNYLKKITWNHIIWDVAFLAPCELPRFTQKFSEQTFTRINGKLRMRIWNRWKQVLTLLTNNTHHKTKLWIINNMNYISDSLQIGISYQPHNKDFEYAIRKHVCFYIHEPRFDDNINFTLVYLPIYETVSLPVDQMYIAMKYLLDLPVNITTTQKIKHFLYYLHDLENGMVKSNHEILVKLLEWSNFKKPGGETYIPVPQWNIIPIENKNQGKNETLMFICDQNNNSQQDHKEEKEENKELICCCVCFEPSHYLVRNEVCQHVACYSCMQQLTLIKSTCPLCRKPFSCQFFKIHQNPNNSNNSNNPNNPNDVIYYFNNSIMNYIHTTQWLLPDSVILFVTHFYPRLKEYEHLLQTQYGKESVFIFQSYLYHKWPIQLSPSIKFVIVHANDLLYLRHEKWIDYMMITDLYFESSTLAFMMNYFKHVPHRYIWIQLQKPSHAILRWFLTYQLHTQYLLMDRSPCYPMLRDYVEQFKALF